MPNLFSPQQILTLFLFVAISHIAISSILWHVWRNRLTAPGFPLLIIAEAVFALGFVFIIIREALPSDFYGTRLSLTLLGNTLLFLHPALYERGLQQFFASQQKTQWVAPTLAIVGGAIFFLIATITHPNNINARTLTYSLIVMVQLSWLTWQVWGYSSQYSDYKILKLPAIALALLAITYLFRAAHHAPLLNQPGVFLNDPIFGVTLLFTALFTTMRGCVDLILVQTRLENSLRTAQKELEQRANFDHLSGLRSRYFFTASLPQLQAQSERIKQPLNLLLFDIDFFKHVNDMHGHPAGDAVITTVGQAVKSTLRASDIAGRLGGDEIAILYISNSEEIPGLITRLRQQIELQTQNLLGGPVTVSIGLSICLSNDHFEQTYQRADTALYAAKSAGRNCCFQYNIGQSSPQLLSIS